MLPQWTVKTSRLSCRGRIRSCFTFSKAASIAFCAVSRWIGRCAVGLMMVGALRQIRSDVKRRTVWKTGSWLHLAVLSKSATGPVGLQLRTSGLERTAWHPFSAVRGDSLCGRLITIPGVGPITTLAFKTGVDVLERFDKSKTAGSHFGLTSRKFNSGEIDYNRRISKCGNAMVRKLFHEAANSLLSSCARNSALKAWAMRIAKTRGLKRAKVALARKLAVVLHRIWLDGSELGRSQSTSAVVP